MKSVLLQPDSEEQLKELINLASQKKIKYFFISEEAGKRLAALQLSQLAEKNPHAYATDEEISDVVEEVKSEFRPR